MGSWFELAEDHLRFSDRLAARRQQAATTRNRPPHNGAPTDPDRALAYHRLGARTECAGYLYLKPVHWNTYVEHVHGVADLEDWIDVKGCLRSHHSLIVQRDDPEDWAYLLVCASRHPIYEAVGWCWGREAKVEIFRSDPVGGRAAFFVPRDAPIIKPPHLLYDELRRRQRHG